MIEEQNLNGFDNKMSIKKLNYPNCRCNNCPSIYFNLLAVAPRCCGKTYAICKLLRHYEENKLLDNDDCVHPMRTILISPTIDANPIFKSLKTLDEEDQHPIYSDTLLQSIIDNIQQDKDDTEYFKKYVEAYKIIEKTPQNKIPDLYDTHPEVFEILEKEDYKMPTEIEQPRFYETPVVFIILDDLLASSDAFNNKKCGKLLNAIIKHRHLSINFIIASQSMKGITKSIRLNCNLFYLGKFSNLKTVENDIYEECSNLFTLEQFIELYNHATAEQYGSLVIDATGKEKRLLKNWDSVLTLK